MVSNREITWSNVNWELGSMTGKVFVSMTDDV